MRNALKNKVCSKCSIEKPVSEYSKETRSKDGFLRICKVCRNSYHKIWYDKNKDKLRRYSKKRYIKNKQYHYEYRIKKTFDISIEEYNEMFSKQNGECAICGIHQKDLNRRLAIDHCHTTNKIRGLLCGKCNCGIGNLEDNIELLKKAIKYLSYENTNDNTT